MDLNRSFASQEFYIAGVAFTVAMVFFSTLLTAWRVRGPHELRHLPLGELPQLLAVVMLGAAVAYGLSHQALATGVAATIALIVTIAIRAWLPRLTTAGALEMAVTAIAPLLVTPWFYFFLRDSGVTGWPLTLWMFFVAVGVIAVGFSFACKLAQQALLTHAYWRRPTGPLPPYRGDSPPKVSLHVPCYSEPPELVIATLQRIAELDYSDFEVVVCDNNTEDPLLWEPVAEYCRHLNRRLGIERFRFYHESPLAGAKAGALNFCLMRTAQDAQLVAVLDADYLSRPDFLSRLVGFFDAPEVGFVQTSHDYRDQQHSRYLRMCYWEYTPYYKVDMPSLQEYNAPFTIGTMCLFRKQVLQDAGGWAEWCLTEDSEISIRIRALGYQGVYLRSTFGRGLIPAIFKDYKSQRFRWTAGPVQQLRRHWRLFLPTILGGRRDLGGWSKLLEFQRSVECLMLAPSMILGVIVSACVLAATAFGHLPKFVVPDIIWHLIPFGLATLLVRKWQWYRLGGCDRLGDMIGGEIARMSLTYVKMVAGIAGLSGKPLQWRRTPKFEARSLGIRAVRSVLPETCIGLVLALLAPGLFMLRESVGLHLSILFSMAALAMSATFLSATAMAVLSERELARRPFPEQTRPLPEATDKPAFIPEMSVEAVRSSSENTCEPA